MGAVTTIVPVATTHVGCVIVTVADEGAVGWAFTVADVGDEIHVMSVDLLTRIVCDPVATPENVTADWYAPPSRLYS
jgi:hypothetical protein